ncbi:MAG TPA: hypothetical protein VNE63_21110 [Candidatus Acidoferrales bacterium]|nr:hypothetical protein [Candidatus Acidoferrales bacterium]
MRFTLHYEGLLPSSGNKGRIEAKWDIRKAFDPQFRDLWKSHPALRQVEDNRHFPKRGGAALVQAHHLHPGPVRHLRMTELPHVTDYGSVADPVGEPAQEHLDLCAPIEKHGAWFRPLIRESYALHCGLKVTFLRKEAPGKVYQGGDFDGRIKTLVDALAMPQHAEQIVEKNTTQAMPIHCLMEDDSMVSGFEVESERLLGDQNNDQSFVRLTIEVDVRVRQATIYNQSFLG